jgi:hypothetical protein
MAETAHYRVTLCDAAFDPERVIHRSKRLILAFAQAIERGAACLISEAPSDEVNVFSGQLACQDGLNLRVKLSRAIGWVDCAKRERSD